MHAHADDVARPVWVTADQHAALVAGVHILLRDSRCQPQQCHILLQRLHDAAARDKRQSTVVSMVVRHLRLIPGSFPVLLTDSDIRLLLTYGRLSKGLATYLGGCLPLAENGWRDE